MLLEKTEDVIDKLNGIRLLGVWAIVSSIIALAHGLDLKVVAESVEAEEQRKLLRLLRCDRMQGYLSSTAVAKHTMAEILRAESAAITQRQLQRLNLGKPKFDERRRVRRQPATRA
jgi:hypothetical protein